MVAQAKIVLFGLAIVCRVGVGFVSDIRCGWDPICGHGWRSRGGGITRRG